MCFDMFYTRRTIFIGQQKYKKMSRISHKSEKNLEVSTVFRTFAANYD
jgi:hypothetical protein